MTKVQKSMITSDAFVKLKKEGETWLQCPAYDNWFHEKFFEK